MDALRHTSVRTKLLLASIVPAAASILVVSVVIGAYLRAQIREETVSSLEAVATIVGENGAASLAFSNPTDASDLLRTLAARPSIVSAAIYDESGRLFAAFSTDIGGDGRALPTSPPEIGSRFVEGDLVVSQPIMLGEERLGTTYILSDMRELRRLTGRLAMAEVVVGLMALLVAFVVSSRLRHVIIDPISRLSRLVRRVSEEKDTSARAEPQSGDELGRLALAFNEMLDEVERSGSALRESAANWQSLVSNVPDFIFIVDRDHRIVSVNRLLPGHSEEDILGTPAEDFLDPDAQEEVREAIEHVFLTGETRSYQVSVPGPDNREHTIVTQASPNTRDGIISQVTLVSREITDQLRLEEQLRQAQKMEAVGQLTGGIAHDFNNLLTVILGNLELLKDSLSNDDPNLELAESAAIAGTRGAALTQRLLAFSRKQALKPVSLNLSQTVSGMASLLRRSLGEDISVETEAQPGLWDCFADQAQTENVILNLAINARDAMPKGGSLTIQTKNVTLDGTFDMEENPVEPGEYVMLTMTDTGIGMTKETVAQAFDPFFTTKEVGKGSGLGLSMVYGFVRQSGGQVRIYSEPNIGTTIRIYLPKAEDSVQGKDGSESLEKDPFGKGEMILVVEDDPAVRGFSTRALNRQGYRTVEAETADEALRIFQDRKELAMVFTDVVLPGGVSGADLAAKITRDNPGFPILLVSGYTEHALLGRVMSDPSLELLQKPYTISELARRVRQTLDSAGPSSSIEGSDPGEES